MATNKQIQSLLRLAIPTLFGCVAAVGYAQGPDARSAGLVDANSAQGLTLFEDVETTESRGRAPDRPGREARVTTAEPEFTLVGVSRIGDKYSALLRYKDGENLIVRADPGANTLIPEHSDYTIVDVSTSSVSIRYPGNNACIEFSDRGVSCNSAANIAQLVLANGEPLAARNPASDLATELSSDSSEEVIDAQVNPGNPFEALRNGRRGDTLNAGTDATRTAGARFTPRRIDPEDVPEGKRVVATPFGDRLVDQ